MFIALEVSIAYVRSLRPVIAAIRKHDRSLAEQLDEAADSTALNVAEGSKRAGRDRTHHYNIAAGSLFEARTAVSLGEAKGYLEHLDLTEPKSFGDRAAALVHRLINPRRR